MGVDQHQGVLSMTLCPKINSNLKFWTPILFKLQNDPKTQILFKTYMNL